MKKLVVLLVSVVLCAFVANAQTAKKKKIAITNTQIVTAPQQAVTVKYAGVNITVPQGQTVLLGQRSDGSIVVRGKNLSNVQINQGVISTEGYSVFSVQPESNVIFLNRGSELTIQDPTGTKSTIYPGQAVSAERADITSVTAPALQAAAAQEAAVANELSEALGEVPAFVAENETTSAASEQATQDVTETEEVLSPSAP